jgi:L-2-hydroxyglutarate oxidase LhgO
MPVIENPDVILIGSGIMSATLGAMLKRLDPRLRIQLFEATGELTLESSDGWNNAGTGHAGFCEVTYPQARAADWRLVNAGIRVQTLKKANRGTIYFGTEVFTAAGGTLSALLGAAVSVNIVRDVIRTCLPHLLTSPAGSARSKEMIPACDEDMKQHCNAGLFEKLSAEAEETLQLHPARAA